MDSRLLEVQIASDDHRMLSANAEAWWLVQNDVFVPFESFLTAESKQVFLSHLSSADRSWFLTFFEKEPAAGYLTRIEPDTSGASMIRVVLTRLDALMDEYLRQNDILSSYDSMLAFQPDLYYEYLPDEDRIILYNTRLTHFSQGSMPLDEFRSQLETRCNEEARAALDTWMNHIRKMTPRFRLKIPCNLINSENQDVQSVLIRGMMVHRGSGQPTLVGVVHPLQARISEENEISYDTLTGAISREHILRIAQDRVNRLNAEGTAVAILDIDFFKHFNDNYGHQHGDMILRQVTAIIQEEIKSAGLVGRIGGDEFLLFFYHVSGETELRAHLRSIKSVIFASLQDVTVSIGAAIYPDDAKNYSDLFMVADYCLYLAKEKGRNRYIINNPTKHPPLEEIRRLQTDGTRLLVKGRDDLPLGEALVQMVFLTKYGKQPSVESLLSEFAARAGIPLVSLWRRGDNSLLAACGKEKNNVEALKNFLKDHALEDLWMPAMIHNGMCVVNTVDKPEDIPANTREPLVANAVASYIYIPFEDADGVPVALVFAFLHRKVFWNQQQYMHFRLFTDLLANCRLTAPSAE